MTRTKQRSLGMEQKGFWYVFRGSGGMEDEEMAVPVSTQQVSE